MTLMQWSGVALFLTVLLGGSVWFTGVRETLIVSGYAVLFILFALFCAYLIMDGDVMR